jgi:hypothetical protein
MAEEEIKKLADQYKKKLVAAERDKDFFLKRMGRKKSGIVKTGAFASLSAACSTSWLPNGGGPRPFSA